MNNPFRLDGRRILVTGASSGLGKETAIWLSNQGAKIILVARNEERLRAVSSQLAGDGHAVEPINLALTKDLSAWMRVVAERHGRLSGLVHAAGVQVTVPIRAMSEDKWNQVIHINSTVSFLLAKAVRQKMVASENISIVYLSSIMSLAGQPALAAYAASKGAINAMTRVLAIELAPERIRVNAIAPGHVSTEMAEKLADSIGEEKMQAIERLHPLGFGQPSDVAYAVNYLLSPASRWVTGTVMVVDGGYLAA